MPSLNLPRPPLRAVTIFQPPRGNGLLQMLEGLFHAEAETFPDRFLFFPTASRATENVRFFTLWNGHLLYFHFGPLPCPVFFQQLCCKPLHLPAGCAHQILPPRLRIAARFSSLTMPRSNIQILRAFPYLRSTMRRMVSTVETSARLPSNVS